MRSTMARAAFVAVWLAATAATAGPRVVLRGFRGPQGAELRKGVAAALRGAVDTGGSPRGADAVVDGSITHRGLSWILGLTVRDGAGKVVGSRSYPLAAPRLDRATADRIRREVPPLCARGASRAAARPEAEPERPRKARARAAAAEDDAPRPRRESARARRARARAEQQREARERAAAHARRAPERPAQAEDDEATDVVGPRGKRADAKAAQARAERDARERREREQREADARTRRAAADARREREAAAAHRDERARLARADAEEAAPRRRPAAEEEPPAGTARRPAAPPAAGRSPAAIGVGLGVVTRRFDLAPHAPALPTYDAPFFPVLMLAAELYPAALFGAGPLADLGLVLRYDRVLGLSSQEVDPQSGLPVTYSNQSERIEGGLTYRLRTGAAPLAPTLQPTLTFGRHTFTLGGSSAMPDTAYTYAALGFGLFVPIAHPSFGAVGDLRYHIVMDVGEVGGFGSSWTAWGLALTIGLRLVVLRHLELFAGYSYERVELAFQGVGPLATTKPPATGTDVAQGARLSALWRF